MIEYERLKQRIDAQNSITSPEDCMYFHYILTYPQCDFLSHGNWHEPCRWYKKECPIGHNCEEKDE